MTPLAPITLLGDAVIPPQPTTDALSLVQSVLLFAIAATLMVLAPLLLGRLVRPSIPHRVKGEPYECGEPPAGPSWVQFDLRFYVVALVFIIFDVEIALFYPWAVVYKESGVAGLVDMLIFFGLIAVGFAFVWRFGYLDWIRTSAGRARR